MKELRVALFALLAGVLLAAGVSCRGQGGATQPAVTPPAGAVAIGDGLVVLPPVVVDNLAVYIILQTRPVNPCGYDTLETALAKKTVVITEVGAQQVQTGQEGTPGQTPPPPGQEGQIPSQPPGQQVTQGGNVNALTIQNNGGVTIILFAGDIIQGGKQDRTIAHDLVIPPHSKPVDVSVFCVEAGRWQGVAAFHASPVLADNALRKVAQEGKGQSAVWGEVGSSNSGLVGGGQSSTYLLGVQDKAVQERISKLEKTITESLDSTNEMVGLAFAVDGRLVSADIYHDPQLFSQVMKRLVRSYALEAIKGQNARAVEEEIALAQRKKPSPQPNPARVAAPEVAQALEKMQAQRGEKAEGADSYQNWHRKLDSASQFILKDAGDKESLHGVTYWE